jgi:hypothetical protein
MILLCNFARERRILALFRHRVNTVVTNSFSRPMDNYTLLEEGITRPLHNYILHTTITNLLIVGGVK